MVCSLTSPRLLAVLALAQLVTGFLVGRSPDRTFPKPGRGDEGLYHFAAVASNADPCSQVGTGFQSGRYRPKGGGGESLGGAVAKLGDWGALVGAKGAAGKNHAIGENLMPATREVVNTVPQSALEPVLKVLPLSDNTIQRRIDEIELMAKKRGSAVDAAIASMLCVGVTRFQNSGLGGGHFATIYDSLRHTNQSTLHRASRKVQSIIARTMAPSAANSTMFINDTVGVTQGGRSIAVPGEILGFWEAHKLQGRLPWRDLFQPAIKLAIEGFHIEPSAAAIIQRKIPTGIFDSFPALKATVTNPATGTWYKEGEMVRRPKLARTLKRIADGGAAEFYNGSLADDIVKEIQGAGGIITKQDLADFYADVTSPLSLALNGGLTIYSPPLPSSGAIAQNILNIFSGNVLNTLIPVDLSLNPTHCRMTGLHIVTLRIIVEQSREWNAQLIVNYPDYEKVFDSVYRATLWKIMRHHDFPQKLMNLIKSMYEGTRCYNMTSADLSTNEKTVLTYHRFIEAFKHAYAARSKLGSPYGETKSFKDEMNKSVLGPTSLLNPSSTVKCSQLIANLTSPEQGEATRRQIWDNQTFPWPNYGAEYYSQDDHGTSQLCVLAPNGDAVSMTSTINLYFGSKIVGETTGITYNDDMDDFSTPGIVNAFGVAPSSFNFIKPGKRPMSSMSPSIILDDQGSVRLVIGSAGGTKITTTTTLVRIPTSIFKIYDVHLTYFAYMRDFLSVGLLLGHRFFGSKIVGETTGIIYNSDMDDFSTPGFVNAFGVPPSYFNFIKPGKRPMSSMSPSIILDDQGSVWLIVGAAGGTKITTTTALMTGFTLWLGEDIKSAIDAPRIHHQLLPDEVRISPTAPLWLIDGLKQKGHKIVFGVSSTPTGILQRPLGYILANAQGATVDGY
ncbi:scoloptoxin SSD14 [Aplysia californica]|uniref:Scoloptoxin SSD14 n=1 Tax=Aplysia californica TaxID=6500 RepID=A0ABM1W0E1_APLCA|nr:scoloptoxin SSD14 [Aplysia californica]